MYTLILRAAAELQSWGCGSRFDVRRTNSEPTKSGGVGLLAAALGRPYSDGVSDLAALRFGTRAEQEGTLLSDFQVADGRKDWDRLTKAQQVKERKQPYRTWRYYLQGAVFLMAFESPDRAFLEELEEAVRYPAFSLYLGRKCCIPDAPLVLGIRDAGLEEALSEEPWRPYDWYVEKHGGLREPGLRAVIEPGDGAYQYFQRDQPESFSPEHRVYSQRPAAECFIMPPGTEPVPTGTGRAFPARKAAPPAHGPAAGRERKEPARKEAPAGKKAAGHAKPPGGTEPCLTRIRLDVTKRKTMAALASPNRFHGAVESSFPGGRERRLWRIDDRDGCCELVIVSRGRPDTAGLVKQFGFEGDPGSWTSEDYGKTLKGIKNGDVLRFTLTANPTVVKTILPGEEEGLPGSRAGGGGRKTRCALISEEEQKAWLMGRAKSCGFSLEPDGFYVAGYRWKRFRKHSSDARAPELGVTYKGTLAVTDAEAFRETLLNGIGRAKAYGMGLLTLE